MADAPTQQQQRGGHNNYYCDEHKQRSATAPEESKHSGGKQQQQQRVGGSLTLRQRSSQSLRKVLRSLKDGSDEEEEEVGTPLSLDPRFTTPFDVDHTNFITATMHVNQTLEKSNVGIDVLTKLSDTTTYTSEVAEVQATLDEGKMIPSSTHAAAVIAYILSFLRKHYTAKPLLPDRLYGIAIRLAEGTENTAADAEKDRVLCEVLAALGQQQRMVLKRLSHIVRLHAAKNKDARREIAHAWAEVTHPYMLRPHDDNANPEVIAVAHIMSRASSFLLEQVVGPAGGLVQGEQLRLMVEAALCTDAWGGRGDRCCEVWCTNYRMVFAYLLFPAATTTPTATATATTTANDATSTVTLAAAVTVADTAATAAPAGGTTATDAVTATVAADAARASIVSAEPGLSSAKECLEAPHLLPSATLLEESLCIPLCWVGRLAVCSGDRANEQGTDMQLQCRNFLRVTVSTLPRDFPKLLKFLHQSLNVRTQYARLASCTALATQTAESVAAEESWTEDSSEGPGSVWTQVKTRKESVAPCAAASATISPQSQQNVFSWQDALPGELLRMRLNPMKWVVTAVNLGFLVAPTYPSTLVVPRTVTDSWLEGNAHFWSQSRFPVFVWHGGGLSPNPEPTFLLRSFAVTDNVPLQTMLQELKAVCGTDLLVIETGAPSVDIRLSGASVANLGLPTVDEISDALAQLETLNDPLRVTDLQLATTETWQKQVKHFFSAAASVSASLLSHKSVLLSHSVPPPPLVASPHLEGQVALSDTDNYVLSLAQLLIDPHYRTLQGFAKLIEKDWVAFSFAFADTKSACNTLHVFMQFMFAVWALTVEFPRAFEFNDEFLIYVLDNLHAQRFGTFLFNTESERSQAQARRLPSLWRFALLSDSARATSFCSALYDEAACRGALLLDAGGMQTVPIWRRYYFRFNSLLTHGVKPAEKAIAEFVAGSAQTLSLSNLELPFCPRITSISDPVADATHSLDLSYNCFNFLPTSVLATFSNLEKLNLGYNSIEGIPAQSCALLSSTLTHLTEMNLSNNSLVAVPEVFSSFSYLSVLSLQHNKLGVFPSSVLQLPVLVKLDLGHQQQIKVLPDVTPAFSKTICDIRLNECGITLIPEAFVALPQLTRMDLSHNQLGQLPEGLRQLTSLVTLKIAQNRLTKIPEMILHLPALTSLDLCGNQLTALPVVVSRLTSLKTLLLNYNKITHLPVSIGQLTNMQTLALLDNPLRELVASLAFLPRLSQLAVSPNMRAHTLVNSNLPPNSTSKAALKDTEDLVNALRGRLAQRVTCYRSALLLLGVEAAGKTSLRRCLRARMASDVLHENDTSEEWVVGFSTEYGHKQARLIVHDFPGSSSFNACRPLLCNTSGDTVVLLVWDVSQPAAALTAQLDRWLACIAHFARKPLPVLLVGTHCDLLTKSELEAVQKTLSYSTKRRFPFVRGACAVSCAAPHGAVKELAALLQQELTLLFNCELMLYDYPYRDELLEAFLAEAMSDEQFPPALRMQDFAHLCEQCSLTDTEQQTEALEVLSSLGVLCCGSTAGGSGSAVAITTAPDLIVLNAHHLVALLPLEERQTPTCHPYNTAVVRLSDIVQRAQWLRVPVELRTLVLAYLFAIGVLLPIDEAPVMAAVNFNSLVFLPTLLPRSCPEALSSLWPEVDLDIAHPRFQSGRRYIFKKFIPYNFINLFMIRLLPCTQQASVQLYWSESLLLADNVETVRLYADAPRAMVCVDVRACASGSAVTLSHFVYDALDSLVSDLNLKVDAYVVCCHCIAASKSSQTLFSVEACENAVVKGQSFMYCDDTFPVSISLLAPDFIFSFDARKIHYSDIELISELGEGGTAIVFKGRLKDSGELVAVKQLKVGENDITLCSEQNAFSEFRREVWVMSGLKHCCIVQLVGMCLEPLCIVTEFIPHGNLFELIHIKTESRLDLPLVLKIALDVACAMSFLHGSTPPQLHRDLKSPNILMCGTTETEPVVAKVADFGLTGLQNAISLRAVDNPVWLAPEVMRHEHPTTKSDVYSFGVILWELITRDCFFGEVKFANLIEKMVIAGERPPVPRNAAPVALCELIEHCWHQQQSERPPFDRVVEALLELIKDHFPHVNTTACLAGETQPKQKPAPQHQDPEKSLWLIATARKQPRDNSATPPLERAASAVLRSPPTDTPPRPSVDRSAPVETPAILAATAASPSSPAGWSSSWQRCASPVPQATATAGTSTPETTPTHSSERTLGARSAPSPKTTGAWATPKALHPATCSPPSFSPPRVSGSPIGRTRGCGGVPVLQLTTDDHVAAASTSPLGRSWTLSLRSSPTPPPQQTPLLQAQPESETQDLQAQATASTQQVGVVNPWAWTPVIAKKHKQTVAGGAAPPPAMLDDVAPASPPTTQQTVTPTFYEAAEPK
eukprot:TRINITY_DN2113_c0_g1_i5.p1 TRINITY_DN2113_c0_g1~~TRINITY_DN2113_c0_g1_i5.p1  ORF type:complete len:2389 (+),score=489.03 TRINITY_DN2113_c0_g1_i5:142-7308(+)